VSNRRVWMVHAAMVLTVGLWGLVFVGVARLLREIDVVQLVVIRFGLMSLCFVGIALSRPAMRPHFRGREYLWLLAAGVLCVPLSQLPIVNGQRYLSPSLASTLASTSPAWAALLAVILLGERFRRAQVLGFFIAIGGVIVVIVTGSGDGEFVVRNPLMAAVSVLSPLSWAGFTIISKRFSVTAHPLATLAVSTAMGMLTLIPLYPHAIQGFTRITPSGWVWLILLVLGGTVLPYILWLYALQVLPASKTVVYMYGIPLAALGWSWVVIGTVPKLISIVGGMFIVLGVVVIQRSGKPQTALQATADNAADNKSGSAATV